MNPKYFHEFLGWRMGPLIGERSRGVESGIERSIKPIEMKGFSFRMFNHKTKLDEEIR